MDAQGPRVREADMFSKLINAVYEVLGVTVCLIVIGTAFGWMLNHNYPNADLSKAHMVRLLSR
jgi:hypothetical protein